MDYRLKRMLDLAVGLAGLVAFAPLMLAAAVCVWFFMGRPVLFRQQRTGLHGQSFTLFKFRTMRKSGSMRPDKAEPDSERLTPVGAILRSLSIDELPQFWNVIRGTMSLVGPRPLLPEYLPWYSAIAAHRHDVKPGITGWAQVHGRNSLGWEEKFELDIWYVNHASLWLDLKILLLTAGQVAGRRGIGAPGQATAVKFGPAVAETRELP
jgi:sugar transferase EpsL